MKFIISLSLRIIPRRYLQLFSHLVVKTLSLFFIGKGVECPVCNHSYRKFMPFGRLKAARDNALCPNCMSLERHRLIWYFISSKTDFFKDKIKMLHIAPEYCFIKRFSECSNIDYITADLESPLAKVKMDVRDIPFVENSFDVVFCNHVLEHIVEDIKAMKEIYRVLKPNGWAILQVPMDVNKDKTFEDSSATSPKERERLFGQNDHVRTYGKDYVERLKSASFEVTVYDYYNENKSLAEKYRFPENEYLYYCFKPSNK